MDEKNKLDKWQMKEKVQNKLNTYTFWAKNKTVPVLYEMMGYDTLMGSHYDKYYLHYTNFTAMSFVNDTTTFVVKSKFNFIVYYSLDYVERIHAIKVQNWSGYAFFSSRLYIWLNFEHIFTFYWQLTAIQCMKKYKRNTLKLNFKMINTLIGTHYICYPVYIEGNIFENVTVRAGTGAEQTDPSTRTLTTDPNSSNHKS